MMREEDIVILKFKDLFPEDSIKLNDLLNSDIDNADEIFQFSFVEKLASNGKDLFEKIKSVSSKTSIKYFDSVEQYFDI